MDPHDRQSYKRRYIILTNRCFIFIENAESCNHLTPLPLHSQAMGHGPWLLGINWTIASSIKDELKAWEFLCKGNKKF